METNIVHFINYRKYTKLGKTARTLQHRIGIQNHLNTQEKYSKIKMIKFNKCMCKVLHTQVGKTESTKGRAEYKFYK